MNTKKTIIIIVIILAVGGYAFYLKSNKSPASIAPDTASAPVDTDTDTDPGTSGTTPTTSPVTTTDTASAWKDGTYTGDSVDAFYGQAQVAVTISNGKITNVTFPVYPTGNSTTNQKSQHAMAAFKTEVITAQNANVNVISGATQTSQGFTASLNSALAKAS